jgi:hypothetical protein
VTAETYDGWTSNDSFASDEAYSPRSYKCSTPLSAVLTRKVNRWNPKAYLQPPLHSAPLQGFGPLPQGLGPAKQAEEQKMWKRRNKKTIWWQARDGYWWAIAMVCVDFEDIDWSGANKRDSRSASQLY